jgi:hypothetical protein
MPCTASTSSVSSPAHSCGVWLGFSGLMNVPGATSWVNWPALMVGSPRFVDHWLTSCRIVEEAYASMIATVWPAPFNVLGIP